MTCSLASSFNGKRGEQEDDVEEVLREAKSHEVRQHYECPDVWHITATSYTCKLHIYP